MLSLASWRYQATHLWRRQGLGEWHLSPDDLADLVLTAKDADRATIRVDYPITYRAGLGGLTALHERDGLSATERSVGARASLAR